MGFAKGSITMSPTHDIPLLLQVLHSRFITHDQLREFMLLDGYELKRASFNWRVGRLVEGGLLMRGCARPITPSPIYWMTAVGALMLAEHSPVLDNGKPRDISSAVHVQHSIGLNDLHLGLRRQGVLTDWQSEVAIRARNELTPFGYVKDYDAVVTVRLEDRTVTFALEYERTPKRSKEYQHIRNLLEQENRVTRFLYVVPDRNLRAFILNCFSGTTVALFVGLVSDFTTSFKEMKVIEASSALAKPITAIL